MGKHSHSQLFIYLQKNDGKWGRNFQKHFKHLSFALPRIRTLMRGGEMRGSVTPTASKLEGGVKRAHKMT